MGEIILNSLLHLNSAFNPALLFFSALENLKAGKNLYSELIFYTVQSSH